jgi:hypothetical protein
MWEGHEGDTLTLERVKGIDDWEESRNRGQESEVGGRTDG